MKEHMVGHSSQQSQCVYCARDLSSKKWNSEFARDLHYKSVQCECGRKVWTRVEFHGSGHDSWDGTHSWKKRFKAGPSGKCGLSVLESRVVKAGPKRQ